MYASRILISETLVNWLSIILWTMKTCGCKKLDDSSSVILYGDWVKICQFKMIYCIGGFSGNYLECLMYFLDLTSTDFYSVANFTGRCKFLKTDL